MHTQANRVRFYQNCNFEIKLFYKQEFLICDWTEVLNFPIIIIIIWANVAKLFRNKIKISQSKKNKSLIQLGINFEIRYSNQNRNL